MNTSVDEQMNDTENQTLDDKEEKLPKETVVMIDKVYDLYQEINKENVDLKKLKTIIKHLNEEEKENYMDSLLYPEESKGCKIPSTIPVPSSSFQLHNTTTLKTNQYGNFAFVFNPFFLCDSGRVGPNYKHNYDELHDEYPTFFSTFVFCNNDSLDGSHVLDGLERFYAKNIGQMIPGVYDQYRLVSACVTVKYIGRLDIASGVIGAGISFDQRSIVPGEYMIVNKDGSGSGSRMNYTDIDYNKYTNFDVINDCHYHTENHCIDGIRMLYFPFDNSYEEYVKVFGDNLLRLNEERSPISSHSDYVVMDEDNYKSGFNFVCYCLGAPASSVSFKVDIYCNFECLATPEFLNYMPITPNPTPMSSAEKNYAVATAQNYSMQNLKKPVQKLIKGNLFDKIGNFFKNKVVPTFKNYVKGVGWKNIIGAGVKIIGSLFT